MLRLKNKNILIISNEAWGDVWYSKHNWAFELSQSNKIFFINPPKKWRILNLFSSKITEKNYSSSLKIISYNNILPLTRFNSLFYLNEQFINKQLKNYFKNNHIENIIFWSFDPYRLINPKLLNSNTSLYFITDQYQTKREKRLKQSIDYIITVSKELAINTFKKPTLILSHAIASSEFSTTQKHDTKNTILYIGNIDHRLDYDLIHKLLTHFPNEHFLFIGKTIKTANKYFHDIFIREKYPNLVHIPPIHFKKLKNYIAVAKLCLAPMLLKVHGNNINHHKLLQYLAFGKPIITPFFKDYNNNSQILLNYKDHNEAIKKMKDLCNNKETQEIKDTRIDFAKKHLYSSLISKIEAFLH